MHTTTHAQAHVDQEPHATLEDASSPSPSVARIFDHIIRTSPHLNFSGLVIRVGEVVGQGGNSTLYRFTWENKDMCMKVLRFYGERKQETKEVRGSHLVLSARH